MKVTVEAQTSEEARGLAADKFGHSQFHISCVFFHKTDKSKRLFVFTTVLE